MGSPLYNVSFKGERDYAQGPDVANIVYETVFELSQGKFTSFDITFHRMIRKKFKFISNLSAPPPIYHANGYFVVDGDRKKFWIVEDFDELEGRNEFDENFILSKMVFDKSGSVTIKHLPGYSKFELWVSMLKALYERKNPDLQGKWIFVRACLSKFEMVNEGQNLTVEHVANVGTKISKSKVFDGLIELGDIYFSFVEEI